MAVPLLTCTLGCGSVQASTPASSSSTKIVAAKNSRHKDPPSGGNHLTVSGVMPSATVGTPLKTVLDVSGGQAPFAFDVVWQALPPGLNLNRETGAIWGIPTAKGTYNFSVSASDLANDYGDHRFTIVVGEGSSNVTVSVTPSSASVAPGGTQQFVATVTGTGNTAVNWTTSVGTISDNGLFTSPPSETWTTATITATSVADPSVRGTAIATLSLGHVSVTVTPSRTTMAPGDTQQFTATVTGTDNTAVNWTASAGTITKNGLFTAPSTQTSTTATITATSVADPTASATAIANISVSTSVTVSVTPSSTTLAPGGTQQFTATVTGTGNTAVNWTASAGTITNNGLFTAPQTQTSTTATITATSVADPTASAAAIAYISAGNPPPPSGADNRYCKQGDLPNFGPDDGPAQMPQSCIYTATDGTPAPGKVTSVAAAGDLQGALNSAQCGDTIQLQAGATYDYSGAGLTMPAKSCDDQHWIVVRTSTPDAQLPPEGTRITPCWSGVASLPGRPSYSCPKGGAANLTAKILVNGGSSLTFSGADHYRFIGLEITRPSGTGVVYNLATTRGGSKIIFDRVWMHGNALEETTRGVGLSDGNQVAVIDSYFSDFHCISGTGACTDSQAISGGCNTSSSVSNTFKIVDNFLESAAQGVLFGGCGANHSSADLEIRRNHFFKPNSWDPSSGSYIGTAFLVKNNFELKDADHVLFEGNVLDSVWGGFSQVGFSILLTPKNQSGSDPGAHVSDVTIRYSTAMHSGGAMQIGAGTDNGASSQGMWNISVHDLIFDDVSNSCYQCNGNALQVTRGDANAVAHDLLIDHITIPRTSSVNAAFIAGGGAGPNWQNVTITNSIIGAGAYQLVGTGFGTSDCSNGWDPNNPSKVMTACWSNYTVSNNVVVSGFGTWPSANWSDTSSGVQFTNYNNGSGGNYQLLPSSPYKNKGTDGKDVGADVSGINTATNGVN